MYRGEVMDRRLDSVVAQDSGHPIPCGHPYREKVIGAGTRGTLLEDAHALRQQLAIAPGMLATCCVPVVQVRQLHSQPRSLERVEALIVTALDMVALRALAQVSQPPQARREQIVVGAHGAAISKT